MAGVRPIKFKFFYEDQQMFMDQYLKNFSYFCTERIEVVEGIDREKKSEILLPTSQR